MKRYAFIILIITTTCFSQTKRDKFFNADYEAIYSVNFQPDSTKTESKKKGFLFTLLIGKKKSLYGDNNKYLLDSIRRGVENGDISQAYVLANLNSMPKPITNVRIVKDKIKNKILYIDNISSQIYIYSEKLKQMKWRIKENIKIVSKYKCQKAETHYAGRDYVAWFANEIPFSDGPYKFNGLPGLIIHLSDSKKHFEFTLIKFKKTNNLKVPLTFIDKSIKINKDEFYKLKDSYLSNPIQVMENEGAVFDSENKKKILEIFKKRKKANNNPLELIK